MFAGAASGGTAIDRYSVRNAPPIAELDAIPVGVNPCASIAESAASIAASGSAPVTGAPATPTTPVAGKDAGTGATANKSVSSIRRANACATRDRTWSQTGKPESSTHA